MRTYSMELNENEVALMGERRWLRKNWRKWTAYLGIAFLLAILGATVNNWISNNLGNFILLIAVAYFAIVYFLFMKRSTEAGKVFLKEIQSK